MIRAWRICQRRWAAEAFSGRSAATYGGRWNSPGTQVVYTAGSQALAALEMIAHTDDPEQLIAVEYVAMAVDFDEELVTELRRLPRNWKDYPAPAEVRRLGDRWVARETSAVLKIPSVIIPSEYNYVLNPGHPDFVHIVRHKSRKFPFDPRLV